MNLSYWEYKTWLNHIDFTIVGSGIVGLSTAIALRKRFPKSNILILEKGVLPQGASTKNAGFACFGSISELLWDLENHSEEEVLDLITMRWEGIQLLRNSLGDTTIDYQGLGGHEVFLKKDAALYEKCLGQVQQLNQLIRPIFGRDPFVITPNRFKFQGVQEQYVTHRFEGQLDTGKMMRSLLKLARKEDIVVLNGVEVTGFSEELNKVNVFTDRFELNTGSLLITTNGFAGQLLEEDVHPARAQVLVTQPIKDLAIQGTFHFDEGYYYFRNIEDRILFGGGRNLDFKTEATLQFGQTQKVQKELEQLLRTIILPGTAFEVDRWWSGIMGVGRQKKPIVKQLSNTTFCGIRLGGMGVAIGSIVGRELAALL